jgi:hypothetical protein
MTVIVTKDAINLREKLSELDKETGIKGEELMRADTSAEAREALQLDQQLFTDFESTGIDDNATSTAITIDNSNNVGIGTASPIYTAAGRTTITINGTSTGNLSFGVGGTGYGNIYVASNIMTIGTQTAANPVNFTIGGAEKVRIDASGNLLVGKTASSFTTAGVELAQGGTAGKVQIQRSSSPLALVNLTDDGSILSFYKGTTTVGSITTHSARIGFGSGATGLRIHDDITSVLPYNPTTGANQFGTVNLGHSGTKFKDLYLSGGVYLGGTVAANLLDDYEEGTWTAVYSPSVSSFSAITMTTFVGDAPSYVKIGRMVTVTAVMETYDLTIGAASGDVRIDGLPFTIDKSGAATISDTVGWAGQNPLSGSILGNDYITLQYRSLVDGDDTILNVTDLTTGSGMSNSNFLKFTLTYMTNA